MSQYKRIFIIGHPGAGKALLAKTLADKLGWQFVNADFELEFRIGQTMSEIVGQQGEQGFHRCESEILSSLQGQEHIVVTTDASIVCSEKNRQLLSNEFVVYLEASTSIQLERTIRNPKPLLLIGNLESFLNKLHQKRDDLYKQMASISINSDDSALEKHVTTIVSAIADNKAEIPEANQNTIDINDLIIFHKSQHNPVHLSRQQAKCLKLLAQGKSSKAIARELNLSHRTVEGVIAMTIEQLGCVSSKELIALYHEQP